MDRACGHYVGYVRYMESGDNRTMRRVSRFGEDMLVLLRNCQGQVALDRKSTEVLIVLF